MHATIQQLAELVHGTVHGDAALLIHAARSLRDAQPGDITFIDNDKKFAQFQAGPAFAAVVPANHSHLAPSGESQGNGKTLIQVNDPLDAFIAIVRFLHGRPEPAPHGIDPRAVLHPSVRIGAEPSVHPFATIGENSAVGDRCRIHSGVSIGRDCRLGNDVVLHPNVVLYDGTVLGDRVIVHANAVLGADGFGYRFQQGKHAKVPQMGYVEIGNDVEIGACTAIDRGTFGPTRIGEGSKIDNHVQIGHNCQVGKHNILVSLVGMAGSCVTGDYVVIAGQVGIADHVTIGAGTTIGAQAGVTNDIPAGQIYLGSPARPERDTKRMLLLMEKLPDMRKDLKRIKQHVGLPAEE
ncbi:MAG: UDP-3-O-(3-hydroxymyristoyl)glucosamine N-acyltransferase [Gemmataceae bacterium]|nr:UDP-3-O-(3-hydroxymyristoyl)glucosamine N-acyltransferase [Gemmataceae bacterium]MCI0741768.1 UDP-3-O-(3-hydroxymyristoyl)glucosamine N-acyltransferase [Gemmataceae bacterium]